MENDNDIMPAEDIFGEIGRGEKIPSRKSRSRGRRKAEDLFAEVKAKMVMRVFGVSRARALEIIAARTRDRKAAEEKADRPRGGEFMSAAEFFGEA